MAEGGLEPSYYLDISSKLTWTSAVVTCEKVEKDETVVAAAGLLARLSVVLTDGFIIYLLKAACLQIRHFYPVTSHL